RKRWRYHSREHYESNIKLRSSSCRRCHRCCVSANSEVIIGRASQTSCVNKILVVHTEGMMDSNLKIYLSDDRDIDTISELAERIWWPTYSTILSAEQIRFMLDKMYHPDSIRKQMRSGLKFYIAQ